MNIFKRLLGRKKASQAEECSRLSDETSMCVGSSIEKSDQSVKGFVYIVFCINMYTHEGDIEKVFSNEAMAEKCVKELDIILEKDAEVPGHEYLLDYRYVVKVCEVS